jgi:hypothetical protein
MIAIAYMMYLSLSCDAEITGIYVAAITYIGIPAADGRGVAVNSGVAVSVGGTTTIGVTSF